MLILKKTLLENHWSQRVGIKHLSNPYDMSISLRFEDGTCQPKVVTFEAGIFLLYKINFNILLKLLI